MAAPLSAPELTSNRVAAAPALLGGVSLWRLLLAGSAFFGLWSAMTSDGKTDIHWFNINYFSQITSLLVGLTAVGALLSPWWNGGAIEGLRGFVRGASTTCALLTMIVFATLLGGGYDTNGSLFEHLITPILALIDWIFVVRNASRVQAWWPAVWLVIPLAYLPVYINAVKLRDGRPLYDFLDPAASDFWIWAVALLAGYLALGYLVWGLGKLRALFGQPPAGTINDEDSRTDRHPGPTEPGQPQSSW